MACFVVERYEISRSDKDSLSDVNESTVMSQSTKHCCINKPIRKPSLYGLGCGKNGLNNPWRNHWVGPPASFEAFDLYILNPANFWVTGCIVTEHMGDHIITKWCTHNQSLSLSSVTTIYLINQNITCHSAWSDLESTQYFNISAKDTYVYIPKY